MSVVLCTLAFSGCRVFFYSTSADGSTAAAEHLRAAEDFADKSNYEQAIIEYQAHIDQRLKVEGRPEWENPWFYLILISDLELRRGDVNAAIAALDRANEMKVDTSLVADRYRAIARWYEERGELDKSFDVLQKYREIDPLLFDAILDRLGRKIVAAEESRRAK